MRKVSAYSRSLAETSNAKGKSMFKLLMRSALTAGKHLGIFRSVASSHWRQRRLLILCYHGLALKDEHEWRPLLFITPDLFRRRMQLLARGGYRIL